MFPLERPSAPNQSQSSGFALFREDVLTYETVACTCAQLCTTMSKSTDVVGERDVGSDDEADGELKKQEDAYANECAPLTSNRQRMLRERGLTG